MAKAKAIKESIVTTHKLDIDCTLDVDNETKIIKVEVPEIDVFDLADLIKAFDGECVKITITNKTESVVENEEQS